MQKLSEKGKNLSLFIYTYICIRTIIFKYHCMSLCSDEEEHVGVESLVSIVHDLWSAKNDDDDE